LKAAPMISIWPVSIFLQNRLLTGPKLSAPKLSSSALFADRFNLKGNKQR